MNRLAFSTGALYPLPSEDALAAVYRAGFPCAELMPQSFQDVTPQFAKKVQAIGIHVNSIHYPLAMFSMLYTAHPAMAQDASRFADDLAALGEQLGTTVIVVHPHYPEDDPLRHKLLELPILQNFYYLAEVCARKGITVGMENSPKGPGATAKGLTEYITQYFSDYPNVKPVVDTTEACEAYEDPIAFLRDALPQHVHLSDFADNRKHLPMGQGSIDWEAAAAVLRQSKYPGVYTLEPSYSHYLRDIDQKLKSAYEIASRIFG